MKRRGMEPSLTEQLEAIASGVVEILPAAELEAKLKQAAAEKRSLVVKYGVDPTAPDLHLGHSVPLRKLAQFQEFGHQVALLIGDFTARIGDPSEEDATRPQLSAGQIEENARTYTDQAFKILDRDRTRLVFNSSWFEKMSLADFIKLASRATVARILERDDFETRLEKGVPLGMHEIIYPLLQGYDSVALESDVEIGGTDQKFNMLAGRELQRESGQPPQVVLTLPILEGIDGGKKMSKSLGNHIGLAEAPEEIFGKVMSVADKLMPSYFRLVTDLTVDEVQSIEDGLEQGRLHPGEAKRRLARLITEMYWGLAASEKAEAVFDARHKPGLSISGSDQVKAKDSIELLKKEGQIGEVKFSVDEAKGGVWIVRLLRLAGFAKTNGEARRLVEQGGVWIGEDRITDPEIEIEIKGGELLRVGKRRLAQIVFE